MFNHSTRLSHTALTTAALITIGASSCWGQVINEDRILLPSDGGPMDGFAHAVAIDNGIIAAGAARYDFYRTHTGAAFLFDASTGEQLFKLIPDDATESDEFGTSITLNNGIVAVGAVGDDDNGESSGSAYLFDANTGDQLFKLLPNNGAREEWFGNSIAIADGLVAVGARKDDVIGYDSGSAYLFDAHTGVQLFKLLPNDGVQGDFFGHSIAIDNGVVAVGVPRNSNENGSRAGSVYLFDASTGEQIAKLLTNDGENYDGLGSSVAVQDGIVVAGAAGDDDNGSSSGSVYLFDVATGKQIAKLRASDGSENDAFGRDIAFANGIVAVGAISDEDNGPSSGSAYLFDASNGSQIAKLLPSDGASGFAFGSSLAIANGVVVVGTGWEDDAGNDTASAYVFDVSSCLDLTIDNLVAGQRAVFTIKGDTPGANALTAYGTKTGQTHVNNYAGYCATFGINNVNQSKIIGGSKRTFDANGEITFQFYIPANLAGQRIFFQSAQRGTCPDECMSNLIRTTIQ